MATNGSGGGGGGVLGTEWSFFLTITTRVKPQIKCCWHLRKKISKIYKRYLLSLLHDVAPGTHTRTCTMKFGP